MGLYLPFTGLDPLRPVRIYRQNMPHWRQDGATYFVTFRLADSVPRAKVEQWQWERRMWEKAHGLAGDLPAAEWRERYVAIPLRDRVAFERRMARALVVELDQCHGSCVLRRQACNRVVAGALRHFDQHRLQCGDFVVMPSHVHWLVMSLAGYELEEVMESVKHFAATNVNRILGTRGQLWQHESHDRIVRDRTELARTRRCIRANPGNACLRGDEASTHIAPWLDA